MPVRETQPDGFNMQPPIPLAEQPAPSFYDTLTAAFSLENDIVNAIEWYNKPQFPFTPDYPLTQKLKETKYWDDFRDNFIGVASDDEFRFVSSQIEQEQAQRDVILRSGWGGTIAGVAAGIISPTIFLPFIGQEKGALAVAKGLSMGALGGALQEIPLQANQASRSVEESVFSVGVSTVLGGLLGGAAGVLRAGEREAIEAGMADVKRTSSIPTPMGASVSRPTDAGNLASGAQTISKGLDTNPLTRSPVTDTIMSDYGEARWMAAQLGDAGLTMEKNALMVPTTPGGTVENRTQIWYGNNVKGTQALDAEYADYVFGGRVPGVAPNARAFIAGLVAPNKLTKSKFRSEITRAGWNGDQHEVPQVAKAAAAIRKAIYDPVLKELEATGLLKEGMKALSDPSYVNRLFDHDAIRRDPQAFVDFLSTRFQQKLNEDFAVKLEKFQLKQAETDEFLTDVKRPQEQLDELKTQFRKNLDTLEEQGAEHEFDQLEESISALRGEARKLTGRDLASDLRRKQLLADARAMEKAQDFGRFKTVRAKIKRRLSNLNKAEVAVATKLENKLVRIDRAEELSMATLNRAAKAGYRILSKMDDWSDDVLDAELAKLKGQFARTAEVFDKGEERLTRLSQADTPEDAALLGADVLQQGRADRLTQLSERIADAEDLGRDAVRDLINDSLQETLAKIKSINDRRAIRTARLKEAAKGLSPEAVAARLSSVEELKAQRARDFNERVTQSGGEGLDVTAGTVDFSEFAKTAAREVVAKIQGTFIRLPTVDIMQGKRGATLARVLDIPSQELAPWLETDIEKLMRSHIRTMAPDIEITRKFGTVNGEEQFKALGEELFDKIETIKRSDMSEAKKVKETARVQNEYDRVKKNLEGMIGRLRHNWGLPDDPNGVGYRMAKVVSNLNVLRFMGGVTIASIPDIARPVMRYGLTRTFKDGWLPLVVNFKRIEMSTREARRLGIAIDAYTQSRAYSLLDVVEDFGRGSKFERGLEYASGKQGLVAAFSYWTDAMKGLTSSIANAKLTDSIAEYATSATPSKKSMEFLAANGIGPQEAEAIWRQLQNGGGEKIDGVWLPNTEDWTDDGAKRAYAAALAREVNSTIVTPGIERPLWTNATVTGKLISQFKSFAFSSTYKTTLAGLQQRDVAFVTGAMISLGLGTMGYYVNGMVKGGEVKERMLAADPSRWADEAVARSGIMSVFGLGQDMLSRIPMTAPYTTFSGGRTTRRGGDDLVEAAFGPTFDLITTGADVLTELDDPTKSTVHKTRTMFPWQNLLGFSRAFDAIENAIPVKENRR